MKPSRLWGVAALCLVSGSGWILVQAYPSQLGYPFAGCIHFGVIGFVASLIAVKTGRGEVAFAKIAGLGVAGPCLFVLPALSLTVAGGTVSASTGETLLCAIPVLTVLAALYLDSGGESNQIRSLLAPAVIGLAGALLLVPAQIPGSARGLLFFAFVLLCCAVVAIANVRMHRLTRGVPLAVIVSVIGLTSAAALGAYGEAVGWPHINTKIIVEELLRCVLFDLPVVWLTAWLLREVDPARLATRFLLVPWVTVVEGYALLRPATDWRTIMALVLLLGGGLSLLLRTEPKSNGLRLT